MRESNFNFKRYEGFDPTSIIEKVKDIPDEKWLEFTFRQNQESKYHMNTLTIPLIFFDINLPIHTSHKNHEKHPYYSIFKQDLDKVQAFIDVKYNSVGSIIRAMIVTLQPKSSILRHFDIPYFHKSSQKFHIPIITNDEVFFSVDTDTVNMRVGEVWEINNLKYHSVDNKSDQKRVHLIVDWEEKVL